MANPELSREQGLLITASAVLVGAVTLSFALDWASSVAVPLVLALFVVYLVGPLVDLLQVRLRAPRWLAILAAFLVIVGGVALLTVVVYSSIVELAKDGEAYRDSLDTVWRDVRGWLLRASDQLGLTSSLPPGLTGEGPAGQPLAGINPQDVLSAALQAIGVGSNLFGALTVFLSNAVLVTLFAVIILAGRRPQETREGLWGEIDRSVQRYLGVKLLASVATGILTWMLLLVLDIPLALVFGLLAFFLNFIPSVGSIIAMVLPLPMAYLAHADQPVYVILALLLPGSVQFLVGNVIEPRLQGNTLDLHPITVLLTLIFWTLLWGVAGAVISVPITAVLKMVLHRFETTRPVAEILAGRLPSERVPKS